LELLDGAFKDNERYITEEVWKRGNQPVESTEVQRRITDIDESINRLLNGLKGTYNVIEGTDYRRSIAETVLKDFSTELS
jgi:hypothetical protein